LQEDPPVGVSGAPSENNIMQWNAVIFGPEGTPFEDVFACWHHRAFLMKHLKVTAVHRTGVFGHRRREEGSGMIDVGCSCFPCVYSTFKLVIEFSEEYPNKPPTVRFLSKMFHPNVYADGSICLDILQNRWSPTYDVSSILTSIQVTLSLF
ncbi:hypothetical protein CIB84_011596, partial [Bambusicola thoracicus]